MIDIHIVINNVKKEYWIADHQYYNKIEEYVENLKRIYGNENITFFATDAKHLDKELEIERHREYKESHYADWMAFSAERND